MRRPLFVLAAACALLAPLSLRPPQAVAAPVVRNAADTPVARVIVKYRANGTLMKALSAKAPSGQRIVQNAEPLSRRTGLALTDGHPIGERSQVVFAKGMSSAALAARLAADPEIEYAEPDRRRRIRSVPNDPLYGDNQPTGTTPTVGQWYLRPPTGTTVSAIDAQTAWDTSTGTSSVVVAVLDTGVRFEHPDLKGKLYPGLDFIADAATANDGSGRDGDASDPGDWVTDGEVNTEGGSFYHCTDPNPDGTYSGENSSWHGTQVAGLIGAATNNGIGMASVGRNVMVLPVRVLGKCGGYDSDIQAGMLWAAGLSSVPVANPHPAKVINMSLGSSGACPASYQDVISKLTTAGVTVVASAGNAEGLAVDAPANCAGVIGVAGVRHIGTKVGFSSVGPEVTISAPAGNCVNLTGACLDPLLTTINTGTTVPVANTYSDSFISSLGTSFSSPLVAGTVALMLSVNPALTPAQIKAKLQATARPFPTTGADAGVLQCHAPNGQVQDECYCTTSTCGAGLLDANAAVLSVAPAAAPTAPLSASNANPAVGATVNLEASAATVAAGHTGIFQWTLSDPAVAQFTSATDGATVTLKTLANGPVTVTLTVTDDTGLSTSASTLITVGPITTATSVPSSGGSGGGGGGGGGGALGLPWLLALAAAVAALRAARPRGV
ncbi:MAG TPA: S8 family peptidase [Albitalea sp.]|nr:S8 family peptidase [Albitalea sp.]